MIEEEKEKTQKLEKLKDALNSPNVKLQDVFPLDLREHKNFVNENFESKTKDSPVTFDNLIPKKRNTISKIIFIVSVVFFLFALIITGFIFFRGKNIISPSQIDISIIGPTVVASGEKTPIDIVIKNNNAVLVEFADLVIEYPNGTRAEDGEEDLPRERISLGEIKSGESIRKSLTPVFFGEEGKNLSINFTVEYRIPSSLSVFEKNEVYEVPVGVSPVSLNVEAFKETNLGQDLELRITALSNSEDELSNLIIIGEFPVGFTFESSNPNNIDEKSIWRIDSLNPGESKVIIVKGKIEEGPSEEKFFRFSLGKESSRQPLAFDSAIATINHAVLVKKPFLGINVALLNSKGFQDVANSAESLRIKSDWVNNLKVPIVDGILEMKFSGQLVDRRNIEENSGFFRSSDNTIIWTKQEMNSLGLISPGQSDSVNVAIPLFSPFGPQSIGLKNQTINIDVTVKGKRLSEDNVPEEIISTVSKKLKVETSYKFSSEGHYFKSPFALIGPIPPKVDQKTEYAITWKVNNSLNDIEDAKVTATLPTYVDWGGVVVPSSEKIYYNSDSKEVTWNIGKILSGGGTAGSFREVSFKVVLIPGLGQVGEVPNILGVATFTGRDTFTKTDLKFVDNEVDTNISPEDQLKQGQGKVIE